MHPIFYYIAPYLLISAVGMYIGNRQVPPSIAEQRWLKFFTYIVIVLIVLSSILLEGLIWIAVPIVLIAAIELIYSNYYASKRRYPHFYGIFIFYILLGTGFFYFSWAVSPAIQLFIYFQVFIFDAFCQITGQLFGKHPLSIKISPSKTMEGLVGGIVFCTFSAVLARNWVNISVAVAIGCGLITCTTAFIGDMLASYFKRLVAIKDYSKLLPGQGGFLDRFDSFIMSGAVYFALIYFLDGFVFNNQA